MDVLNANDMRRYVVSVDSRFRRSYDEPPSDFFYEFAHVYRNVIRVRVASVEIPLGFYNFSKVKRNTMFRIDISDYVGTRHHIEVIVRDGDYTEDGLLEEIQAQFYGIRDRYGIFLRIARDVISRRVTIYHDGSAPPPCPLGPTHCATSYAIMFGMVGLEGRRYDFGLGYNLGFTEKVYTVNDPFQLTGESLMTVGGDNYLLLGIDDHYAVEHKTDDSYVQCLAKILVKRDGRKDIIFDDGYTVLSNEIVFPRPMDMRRIRVRLMDAYGVCIDLHHLNYSISLEMTEVMNVEVYDGYRKSVWTKDEPKAVRNISGSSTAIAVRNFN